MKEGNISKLIQVEASRNGSTTFRNNVGTAWQGSAVKTATDGSKVILDPRPISFGLCEGSSDLIGITPVTITQSMVGMQIGVFTAIEVKTPTGSVKKSQQKFIEHVRSMGGIAGVIRSPSEVKILLGKK